MKRSLTVEGRRSLAGFTFTIPWVIGFMFLYAYPLIMSLVYTFNDLHPATGELTWVGLKNYKDAFLVDSDYVRTLLDSLKEVAYTLPSILVFSFVIALFLNQKFRSARFFRAIFFLPIIINSGPIISIMQGDGMSSMMLSGERGSSMFTITSIAVTLREMGATEEIITFVSDTASSIFSLSWQSGVQILLFLTGLSSVNPSVYEAANIDGCTAWESFWKITFPLVAPITLVNIIYTLTDSFISSNNKTMGLVLQAAQSMKFSYSATLAWIYFFIIVVIIGAVYSIINKRITYIDM